MPMKINSLYDSLNPTFYKIALAQQPNKIVKGGRSGTKSSAIAEILVDKKMRDPKSNTIAFRQKQNSLRLSVYNQIAWALHKQGVADQFIFRGNPMTILHKEWNTGFYFMGMDDPQKVKGMILEEGYISDLWFEEADSLRGKDEIDTVQDTFIRKDLPDDAEVDTWVSYNPPRNPYHWINEWAVELRNNPDWFIHHSTYLDDVKGYNSKQILRKIETYKEHDPNYYEWMYLGEVVGMGTNIYNMDLFQLIDELPDDDPIVEVGYSADAGHQTSATSVLLLGITAKQKLVLLDTYYYEPAGRTVKKAPSELSEDIRAFIVEQGYASYTLTIDSAEGALRNQYFKDYGERWVPVRKKRKEEMINYTHDILAQGRFYVLNQPNNQVFIEEAKRYEWDEVTLKSKNPQPIAVADHTLDAWQYYLTNHARRLGLK